MGAVCCCLAEPIDFDGEVNLFHFELHRAVGKGAFGKVFLSLSVSSFIVSSISYQVRVVEYKRTKKLYALKYIDKAKCIKQKAVANVIQERRLLEEVRLSRN
jgi:serine/threonine kinase 32